MSALSLLEQKSIFETHIGFPKSLKKPFDAVMANGDAWSPLTFEKIVRANDSARYDAHDVPGGIRYLATANSSNFSDAMVLALAIRELVGANKLVRVEIEEIIGVNDLPFEYDHRLPDASHIKLDGLDVMSDFPDFEAHISVKRADGTPITDAALERQPVEAGFRYNEFAVTCGAKKGIFTMFHDSAENMFSETRHAANALRSRLSDDYIIKTSMERILFCASFG